jgi:hypothetical protein
MFNLPIKNKICLAKTVGLFLCGWIMLVTNQNAIAGQSDEIIRHIQYSFTLQNKSARLLEKAEFWTYAPVKQTATQYCDQINASHQFKLISDEQGNQIMHFSFSNLPPFATKIITIKVGMTIFSTPKSVADKQTDFLKPEKNIESTDQHITQIVKKLHESTTVKTAENIFSWVIKHVEYSGYSGSEQGALHALNNKKGDCTELMDLFIALSRAASIPSRGVAGYVMPENGILKPMEFHNWAEFYDENRWNIVDPQKKVFMQNQADYIAMRIIKSSPENPMAGFNRFRFSGEGLVVSMNK